uniref:Uncharacterized protein n=1 Tax=Chromera velia CCMP2878 TaxID=1169474 RepID=A0A0G4GKK9_9ALVE|eukprot:Cvel_22328.t1-p1 / transcript=Cvel_22328.t1 / gene=Cvel_22328 / organism=Chromera_velia_CCMP2878 / gene_product=hypothetical protein / transcript_product=hypothetical protein / location=Cvel_scaffold2184:20319-22871(+) / protein_length=276 / sequence_SO=supercontig / SO=protein_coding / is_pseudo=false
MADGTGHQEVLLSEVQTMMTSFGDSTRVDEGSKELVGALTKKFITDLAQSSQRVAEAALLSKNTTLQASVRWSLPAPSLRKGGGVSGNLGSYGGLSHSRHPLSSRMSPLHSLSPTSQSKRGGGSGGVRRQGQGGRGQDGDLLGEAGDSDEERGGSRVPLRVPVAPCHIKYVLRKTKRARLEATAADDFYKRLQSVPFQLTEPQEIFRKRKKVEHEEQQRRREEEQAAEVQRRDTQQQQQQVAGGAARGGKGKGTVRLGPAGKGAASSGRGGKSFAR